MIFAPLGIAAAVGHIQSMAENVLQPITSKGTTESFESVLQNQKTLHAQYAKAKKLVGQKVTVENSNGEAVTGTVEKISLDNKGVVLQVDGHNYNLSQLKEVLGKESKGVTV